jgi:hypothetical protein
LGITTYPFPLAVTVLLIAQAVDPLGDLLGGAIDHGVEGAKLVVRSFDRQVIIVAAAPGKG